MGLVRVAGTCACATADVFEILTLEWQDPAAEPPTITHARVETIGPQHHATLYTTAGRFGQSPVPLPLPDIPPAPLVDLATARRLSGPEALAACMVLVERLRVVAGAMLYATDNELTLMIRLTDRRGAPDPARALLWLYLTPTQAPEWGQISAVWVQGPPNATLWVQAPLYSEDGWYGFQYRGPVPNHSLALSLYHATLGPDLSPQPGRARIHGAIPGLAPTDFASSPDGAPYATLQLGRAAPRCPWDARAPAVLLLTFTAQLAPGPLPTFAQLQEAARALGCNISVPARRITLTVAPTGSLTVTVRLESFLRAYDVRLALSDTGRLLALLPSLRLPASGLRSLPAAYAHDPPDPPSQCPRGYYFSDAGTYQPAPAHSQVGPGCYGFSCLPGYTLDQHAFLCVPAYVADWIFWTVVGLVSTMAFAVVLCACTLRLLCGRRPEPDSEPKPESEPEPVPDHTLPISVTADGNLLFEAVISSESEFSSSDSDSDVDSMDGAEVSSLAGAETEISSCGPEVILPAPARN